MSIKENIIVSYPQPLATDQSLRPYPSVDAPVYARYLTNADVEERNTLRGQDFQRRYINTGLMTPDSMQAYIQILDKPSVKKINGPPKEQRETGVFVGDRLVAVQRWGVSTYVYSDIPAMVNALPRSPYKDNQPAYIDMRCLAEPGMGFGSILRHAGALQMAHEGFAVVGRKILEAQWRGHTEEIHALQPVLVRRSEEDIMFPVPTLEDYSTGRTEVYTSITGLTRYLEARRPWLANATITTQQ